MDPDLSALSVATDHGNIQRATNAFPGLVFDEVICRQRPHPRLIRHGVRVTDGGNENNAPQPEG